MKFRAALFPIVVIAAALVLWRFSGPSWRSEPAPIVAGDPAQAVARSAPPAVPSAPESAAAVAKVPDPSQDKKTKLEKFEQLKAQVKAKIPSNSDMQKLTDEEVHTAPQKIVDAAVEMSKMEEAIKNDPSLKPEGIKFYKNCAEDDSYPSSVRAGCVVDLHRLGVDEVNVPERVRRLAKKLE